MTEPSLDERRETAVQLLLTAQAQRRKEMNACWGGRGIMKGVCFVVNRLDGYNSKGCHGNQENFPLGKNGEVKTISPEKHTQTF